MQAIVTANVAEAMVTIAQAGLIWDGTIEQAVTHLEQSRPLPEENGWANGNFSRNLNERLEAWLRNVVGPFSGNTACDPLIIDVLMFECIARIEQAAAANTPNEQLGDEFIIAQWLSAANQALARFMNVRLADRAERGNLPASPTSTTH